MHLIQAFHWLALKAVRDVPTSTKFALFIRNSLNTPKKKRIPKFAQAAEERAKRAEEQLQAPT